MTDRATAAVLASTRALLRALPAQAGVPYADDTWSPVSDHNLVRVARRMGVLLRTAPLGPGVQEIALPAYFGAPVITVSAGEAAGVQRLALRHGLAHLIAGELEAEQGAAVRYMSSLTDWMTMEERRADLFALADLIPDRMLAEFRAESGERELWYRTNCELRRYAPAWPQRRAQDRVALRLALQNA